MPSTCISAFIWGHAIAPARAQMNLGARFTTHTKFTFEGQWCDSNCVFPVLHLIVDQSKFRFTLW